MTQLLNKVIPEKIAPLENVKLFDEVVYTLLNREPGLPGFATFYGPSGFGKTKSATSALMRTRCPMILADLFMTKKSLLQNLIVELQLPLKDSFSINTLVKMIVAEFRAMLKPILFIDEADILVEKGLIEAIRAIHNMVPQLSVILLGEELLPHALRKWERVDGRVLIHQPAAPCSLDDTILLKAIHCPEITVSKDLISGILESSAGSARRTATNLSKINNIAINNSLEMIDFAIFNQLCPEGLVTRELPKARKFS